MHNLSSLKEAEEKHILKPVILVKKSLVSYRRLVIQEMAVSRFISIGIFPPHLLMVFSDTVE